MNYFILKLFLNNNNPLWFLLGLVGIFKAFTLLKFTILYHVPYQRCSNFLPYLHSIVIRTKNFSCIKTFIFFRLLVSVFQQLYFKCLALSAFFVQLKMNRAVFNVLKILQKELNLFICCSGSSFVNVTVLIVAFFSFFFHDFIFFSTFLPIILLFIAFLVIPNFMYFFFLLLFSYF